MRTTQTLQFLGATGTVTGSKFLVTSGQTKVLVDCGMYQGIRELRERNWHDAPRQLDSVYVVHGEPHASNSLARSITAALDCTAVVPRYGERVRLDMPNSPS